MDPAYAAWHQVPAGGYVPTLPLHGGVVQWWLRFQRPASRIVSACGWPMGSDGRAGGVGCRTHCPCPGVDRSRAAQAGGAGRAGVACDQACRAESSASYDAVGHRRTSDARPLRHLDLVHRVHLSVKNSDGHDPRLRALRNQDDFAGCSRTMRTNSMVERSDREGYTPQSCFTVSVRREYYVFAMALWRGGILL